MKVHFWLWLLMTANTGIFGQEEEVKNNVTSPEIVFESEKLENDIGDPIVVRKCCDVASVLVEVSLGKRECQKNSDLNPNWRPQFFDLDTASEVERPSSYRLAVGEPNCSEGEHRFPVYHHANTDDELVSARSAIEIA
jgi:hypothetical protein